MERGKRARAAHQEQQDVRQEMARHREQQMEARAQASADRACMVEDEAEEAYALEQARLDCLEQGHDKTSQ